MFRSARQVALRVRSKRLVNCMVCAVLSYCIAAILLSILVFFQRYRALRLEDNDELDLRLVHYDTCPWNDTLLLVPEFVRSARCYGNRSGSGGCKSITCPKLLLGEAMAVRAAVAIATTSEHDDALTDQRVLDMASDCSSFYERGKYERRPRRATDAHFPIAFNLMLHSGAGQFERLLRAIYRPQNVYCLHVDVKSSKVFFEAVVAVTRCFDNVFLASKRQHIVYAGFSQLKADINCMSDHLTRPSLVRWRYLLNVPETAYPLRTPEEMVNILRVYNGSNDIEGLPTQRVIHSRFRMTWHECFALEEMIHSNSSHVPPPHDLSIVRGSAYGVFSRAFVRFIIHDWRAQDLLEWLRPTHSPNEHYWSTLNHLYHNPQLLTPGGYQGLPESKPSLAVYVRSYADEDPVCTGYWQRDACVFGIGDLPLIAQRQEFFINAFDLDIQPVVFECMEAWLRYRGQCQASPFDLEFYRRLPFVTNQN